jgi:hypothetical protein
MLAGFSGTIRLGGVYTINPAQMAVEKPKNIDDEDIVDGKEIVGKPIGQSTCMSYSLQRIRLAEVFRRSLDRTQFAALTPEAISFHLVQELDAKMNRFWHDTPAFFGLDYDLTTMNARQTNLCTQRYVLNLFFNGQRCRIHIPYLARGAIEPAYASSRATCLESARLIFRSEQTLEREEPNFATTRLRISTVLHHVFLAFTVLLLDICLAEGGTRQLSPEAAIGWRILQDTRTQSQRAAVLIEPLGRVMSRYNVIHADDGTAAISAYSDAQADVLAFTPSLCVENLSSRSTEREAMHLNQDWLEIGSTLGLSEDDWSGSFGGVYFPPI